MPRVRMTRESVEQFQNKLNKNCFATSEELKIFLKENLPDAWHVSRYRCDYTHGIATIAAVDLVDGISTAVFIVAITGVPSTPSA